MQAQLAVGRFYLMGLEEIGSDPAEAEKWLSTAAGRGNKEAKQLRTQASVINNSATGQLAGSLANLMGGGFGVLAGGLQTKASVVTLTMFDIRSGVQIAISEGNATSTNFGATLGAFGGGGAAGLSGFSRTPEGKATVAAFVDAYNSIVISLRNYKAQEVKGGLGKGGVLKMGQ